MTQDKEWESIDVIWNRITGKRKKGKLFNRKPMTQDKTIKCPRCGSTNNESLGNDFHCADCPYTECVDKQDKTIKSWEDSVNEIFEQQKPKELIAYEVIQSINSLLSELIGDVERSKNWDKVEPNFDLPEYLRNKYVK